MTNKIYPTAFGGYLLLLATVAILSGCSITPKTIPESEVKARVAQDQFNLYRDQEPVFRPVTFNEAVARALKYNLDYRLKIMEVALSSGLAEVSRYEMLPNLLATAGYASRNNDSGGTSVNILTGAVSLLPSTSQERMHQLSGAEFSWNLLDFGVSYYRAKQAADQVLVANERRNRVIQNILLDVRSAYWRAAGSQRLVARAEKLEELVRQGLEKSKEIEAQGLLPPKDALSYQRLLLDAVALLNARRQELQFAKRELAALMNITPGTEFVLADEAERPLMPPPYNVAELEELALVNRPELREEDYKSRISANDARRQLATLLPGVSLSYGSQYDSNKYLFNQNWAESGLRVSMNLLRLLSLPALNKAHEAQKEFDDARRLALSMAVLTQVRVAIERYRMALKDLEVADESSRVDQRLASFAHAAQSTRVDAELEVIRADTRALNSEYQRAAAYAAAQTAFGRIYNSLGLEVLPDLPAGASIGEMAERIAANISAVENDTMATIVTEVPSLPAFSLRFETPMQGQIEAHTKLDELKFEKHMTSGERVLAQNLALPEEIAKLVIPAVERAMTRNKMKVAEDGKNPTLSMQLVIQPPGTGARRAQWILTLFDAAGKELGQTRYTSTLSAMPTPKAISAFAEAAVVSNLKTIASWAAPR